MNENNNSLALLPNGFADLLPPFAENEASAVQILMDKFSSFGYRRIKPPLVEFEDGLLAAGVGANLGDSTFRLMDPVSHRMMGLRSDVTPQISRIVSSRLRNEARPLRIAYANDVLRTRASLTRSERQFTQVGCEFIGAEGCVQSDVEICMVAILGLKDLGVCDITLDLTIPRFVSCLLGDMDGADVSAVERAVAQRDVDALLSLKSKQASIIAQSMDAMGAADDALVKLEKIKFDKVMRGNILRLRQVCDGISAALEEMDITDVSLSIDVLEQSGFEYHKALGFTFFANGSSAELGRGGVYDLKPVDGKGSETAKGFTLYMDAVVKCCSNFTQSDKVFVSANQPWGVVSDLQEQGFIVVRGVDGDDSVPSECTHIYKDGEIKKIVI